jgi:hypothetical protein
MYKVTYKNRLKQGKNLADFQNWLMEFWSVQQTWSAKTVRCWCEWEKGDTFVLCEYKVEDIGLWNRQAVRHSASGPLRDLERIVEPSRVTIKRILSQSHTRTPN